MRRLSLVAAAALLAILLGTYLPAAPAQALDNQQPPDISVGTCIENGGSVEQPAGSPIRACCLDSDITGVKGCYICDYKWENCTWDPSYKQGGKGKGKKPVDETPDLSEPQLLSE